MTPDKAQQRVDAIEQMQTNLTRLVLLANAAFLADLLESRDTLLTDSAVVARIYARFQKRELAKLFSQIRGDLLTIADLNRAYFQADPAVADVVTEGLLTRLGLDGNGKAIAGGLVDVLGQDTTVRVALSRFVYGQQAAGIGPAQFAKNLRAFIGPTAKQSTVGARPALLSRPFEMGVYDLYQQSDRLAQDAYATELGLTYFLYIGGKITTSRPFCVARNGKVFSRAEIERFGTPQDAFGGYSNKEKGLFSGKPSPYSPFQMLGGYGCVHTISAISDREAQRLRSDI